MNLLGLSPQILLALAIVDSRYTEFGEAVITSVSDGEHGYASLHKAGHAVDLRIRHVPEQVRQRWVDSVTKALGPAFDVVLEQSHMHIEWNPK